MENMAKLWAKAQFLQRVPKQIIFCFIQKKTMKPLRGHHKRQRSRWTPDPCLRKPGPALPLSFRVEKSMLRAPQGETQGHFESLSPKQWYFQLEQSNGSNANLFHEDKCLSSLKFNEELAGNKK